MADSTLPPAAPPSNPGPRLVKDAALADTQAGQELQAEQLKSELKRARSILLWAACVLMGVGALIGTMASFTPNATITPTIALGIGGIFAMGVAYLGLYAWAAHDPRNACIAGMVLFGIICVIDAVAMPNGTYKRWGTKLIVLYLLFQGVQAGAKYRALREKMASEAMNATGTQG